MKLTGSPLLALSWVVTALCAPRGVLRVETRALETVSFQIVKRTAGAELKREDLDMLGPNGDGPFDGIPLDSPTHIEYATNVSNTTMGIYAGKEVDPNSLIGAVKGFMSQNMNGTSMMAAQRCGPDVPENQYIGFILDATKSVADMMMLWHAGKCITDFESEEAWNDVIISIRDEDEA